MTEPDQLPTQATVELIDRLLSDQHVIIAAPEVPLTLAATLSEFATEVLLVLSIGTTK